MKDFVKMVLAVICGFFIIGILCFILSMGFLGAAIASGSGTPSLPKSGVLKIDLSKVAFGEQTLEDNPLSGMDASSLMSGGGSTAQTIGIWDAVQAIHAAAEDPAVKYIYLRTDDNVSSVTALGEVREASSAPTAGSPSWPIWRIPARASIISPPWRTRSTCLPTSAPAPGSPASVRR